MIADIVFFVVGLVVLSAVWFAAGFWYAKSRSPFPPPPPARKRNLEAARAVFQTPNERRQLRRVA